MFKSSQKQFRESKELLLHIAAMECVRKYFAEEATSRVLNDLWFDEKACITHRTSYMQYGKGLMYNTKL